MGKATPINHDDIKALIAALGYREGHSGVWKKRYAKHRNFAITVDFASEKIDYLAPMELEKRTTSNFSSSENFVVLECVDRLLTKGYSPASLTLEQEWPMGRVNKGRLDILVRGKNGKSYLMIECKTWGEEYEKEKKKMLKNGGQLFSYYQQDKNVEYLCLYTSRLDGGSVKYENDIVKIEDDFKSLGDVKEVHTRWNKQFSNKGIFDKDILPYGIELKALTPRDLEDLQEEDGSRIYNQFLEILRHNVVSDKGNAFNKIFNLFLCKILDENRGDNKELDFQWIEGRDTYENLLSRLNDLYKRGMKRFLKKNITDYTEKDIVQYEDKVQEIIRNLRLYKNQEFAFVEVFNEESFRENARIVKEVVQLLQRWRIRYNEKQQFLGDFFELLLNTGFKQESGQFFSPVPLVRFIVQSLPLDKIIKDKIKQEEDDFLPYVIDFACGSGHFLTEMMDVLQRKIDKIGEDSLTPSQQKKLIHFKQGDFEWADDYIYGIERDYRLVKTTKLACFLHGDGEAKVAHASGLAPFNTKLYQGKLRADGQDNPQFDILITNPPYSVAGFRSTVEDGEQSFELFNHISDASSEIEVLFIERMKQIVKPDGFAAIILPQSIISNAGNYALARELILRHFHLKALVLLGGNAFMATGTNTVVLFLQKRKKSLKRLETKEEYQKMAGNSTVVVVDSGEKNQEKRFLGYEFSSRRGNEGIHPFGEGGLLDEGNILNPTKANSYILRNLLGKKITSIDESLTENIHAMPLADCFDWEAENFVNSIHPKKKINRVSQYSLVKLGEIAEVVSGQSPKGKYYNEEQKGLPFYQGKKEFQAMFISEPTIWTIEGSKIALENDILMSVRAPVGAVNLATQKICIGRGLSSIRGDKEKVNQRFLFYVLRGTKIEGHIGAAFDSIRKIDIEEILIPLPSLDIQQAFIKEMNGYQKRMDKAREEVDVYSPMFAVKPEWERVNLEEVASVNWGNLSLTKSIYKEDGKYSVFSATGQDGKTDFFEQQGDAVILSAIGAQCGKCFIASGKWTSIKNTITIRPQKGVLNEYLYYLLNKNPEWRKQGKSQPFIPLESARNLKVPIPSLAEQQAIANRLEAERQKIEAKKALIEEMKHKQQEKLATLWKQN